MQSSHTQNFRLIEHLLHTFSPMCQKILVSHTYNNNPSNIEKKSIGPSKNTDEKKKKSDQKRKGQLQCFFTHKHKEENFMETKYDTAQELLNHQKFITK